LPDRFARQGLKRIRAIHGKSAEFTLAKFPGVTITIWL
jgi:hypothetical protein